MKPKILIVEDEPGIADTIQYALRTDGFEPAWCATGEEALARATGERAGARDPRRRPARRERLRDLQAPARDERRAGRVPHRAQRRDRPRRRPRARRRRLHRQAVLAARAGGARALDPAPQRSARRRAGDHRRDGCSDAVVDQPDRRRRRPDADPLLRPRARAVALRIRPAETLASRPGHVFTRDALLDRVWGDDSDSMDRTVDAHVKTLRAKMKAIAPERRADPHPARQRLRACRRPAGRAGFPLTPETS